MPDPGVLAPEIARGACGGNMVRDELIRRALEQTNWDLLVCAMPANVLLLSGYWPAVGYSVALATRDGRLGLLVPEDDDDLAEQQSWVDEVVTYAPGAIDHLTTAEESVHEGFVRLKLDLRIEADRIGFEQTDAFEPASYAPQTLRGSAVRLVRRAFPSATLAPADELLSEMRTVKTPAETEHIRTACRIAEQAFDKGVQLLRPGMTEVEAAAAFRVSLSSCLRDFDHVKRCDGFVQCMSGLNSGKAFGPYPRSRSRTIEAGDLVILRCHSYANGYWADIVRTYHIGAGRYQGAPFPRSPFGEGRGSAGNAARRAGGRNRRGCPKGAGLLRVWCCIQTSGRPWRRLRRDGLRRKTTASSIVGRCSAGRYGSQAGAGRVPGELRRDPQSRYGRNHGYRRGGPDTVSLEPR